MDGSEVGVVALVTSSDLSLPDQELVGEVELSDAREVVGASVLQDQLAQATIHRAVETLADEDRMRRERAEIVVGVRDTELDQRARQRHELIARQRIEHVCC